MNDLRNVCILLLFFSAALFLYALILFRSGNPGLIARDKTAKMKNGRAYAKQFAKVIALVAAAPFIAGITGLISGSGKIVFRILVGGAVLAIAVGIDLMKKTAS